MAVVPRSVALVALLAVTCACGVVDAADGVDATASRAAPPARPDVARSTTGAGAEATGPAARSVPPPLDVDEIVAAADGHPMPTTAAVVGDSLTLSAVDEITDALDALGLEAVVDGMENRRLVRGSSDLPSGTDAIEAILDAGPPELWVVALGTNDVGAQVSDDDFLSDLVEVLRLVPDDAPLVWVDLWIRDRPDQIATANRTIRSALGRRSAPTVVVDWHSHGEEPGVIVGDGVHLTEEGQRRFAGSIAAAVESMFDR